MSYLFGQYSDGQNEILGRSVASVKKIVHLILWNTRVYFCPPSSTAIKMNLLHLKTSVWYIDDISKHSDHLPPPARHRPPPSRRPPARRPPLTHPSMLGVKNFVIRHTLQIWSSSNHCQYQPPTRCCPPLARDHQTYKKNPSMLGVKNFVTRQRIQL